MNKIDAPSVDKRVLIASAVLFAVGCYSVAHANLDREKFFVFASVLALLFFLTTINLILVKLPAAHTPKDDGAEHDGHGTPAPSPLVYTLIEHGAMKALAKTLINLNARFDQSLCLVVAAIDDTEPGEATLRALSLKLTECLRETDVVGLADQSRLMVVLPNTSKDEGYRLAEKLRMEVNKSSCAGRDLTLSIGCIEIRKKEAFEEAFKRAAKALECARQGGKNQTVVA